ncbi:MAG: hypothetical protein IIZ38_15870 [Sphingomonas sp.]|uniref:hypothetical protein n=1 Tax=Sphingomonas sp. TaxID=28214 RepID=UPI0025D2A801|nr:hypothetical protein [Sphingomonas sp.]MBQ1499786.1 hypothetical protein [Sphingomonas sp.]
MISIRKHLPALALATAVFGIFSAAPAAAQATRTWVSGVGDDVNPCSRTAPCKTFAGAISKTAAGGEIDCLDPGGFGTVTITKSITIDCTGTFGSVLNSGVNGIIINDSASGTPNTAKVVLRGLSINGAGSTQGINGIRFLSGASLVVENVFISNQGNGYGISFQPAVSGSLTVSHSVLANNGNSSSGGGILVQPTGSGTARATIDNVQLFNSSNESIRLDSTGSNGAGVFAEISNSVLSGADSGLNVVAPSTLVVGTIINSQIYNNGGIGINSQSALARVEASGNTISANGIGVSASGGAGLASYGDNRLSRNTVDGSFTNVIAKQ